MSGRTPLVIVGAGPYGLATAVYARHRGIPATVVGKPLELWTAHMPAGMFLRSPVEWHFDPLGDRSFLAFLREHGARPVNPIPIELFRDYARWFVDGAGLDIVPRRVRDVRRADSRFDVLLDDGRTLGADAVLVTPGLGYFKAIPSEIVQHLPADRYSHSVDYGGFDALVGKRCLIVGGRQSAFEWAALMAESGVARVHLVYHHATPRFEESDWSMVDGMVDSTLRERGWFRRLPAAQQEAHRFRFWAEGRQKLEPWLEARVRRPNIDLRPNRDVVDCRETLDGEVRARLSDGESLAVDHVMLATGFAVDVRKVPYLSNDSIIPALATEGGYPVLDEDFQSSIPKLFFAGLVASRAFGPFMGFMRGCAAAAQIITERLARDQ